MSDSLKVPSDQVEIPFSILDTDLYKFTMQIAVLRFFPDAVVTIEFTNRSPEILFSRRSFDWIQDHVNLLSILRLTPTERSTLAKACPYFPPSYLDYLSSISLSPKDQVRMTFVPKERDMGGIECTIQGLWRDCILYEVPIMSIISEAYFMFDHTDWSMDGVQEHAKRTALDLLSPPSPIQPLLFSEFGTRRRRSFRVQDLVMKGLVEGYEEWKSGGGKVGGLSGSSNVYFALKYGLKPMGTIAHEWIMAIGAVQGYKGSNGRAMDMWEEGISEVRPETQLILAVYPRGPDAPPLTMLTDTFTAQAFFVDFRADPTRALRWGTLRQDSGDPFEFVREAKKAWADVEDKAGVTREDGVVAKGKRVIFSDGLDVEKAVALQKGCDELKIGASFGIGTFLTNDFQKASNPAEKSKPLNMVIKLNRIDGKNCVKLSDDKGKYTGDLEEVRRVQRELGLSDEHEEKQRG